MCNQSQTELHRVAVDLRTLRARPARPRPGDPPTGRADTSTALEDLSGQCVGARYHLVRPLGRRVSLYQARYTTIGERVLVRLFTGVAGDAAAQRFMAEARAAALLHHGHIAHVTDFGVDTLANGTRVAYMAMENLKGESLTTTLARQGPLHWTRVLAIARQVCRALIAAHDRGVVHGNLGLSNCLRIPRLGAPDFIKLLDFGVAGLATRNDSPSATRAGPADDIHALGVLMYRLITGQMPDASQRPAQLLARLDLSPALTATILATLGHGRRARPVHARALYRELVAAEPTPPPTPCPPDLEPVGAPAVIRAELPAEPPRPATAPANAPEQASSGEPPFTARRPVDRTRGVLFPGFGVGAGVLPKAGVYGSLWPAWALWTTLALMAMRAFQVLQAS